MQSSARKLEFSRLHLVLDSSSTNKAVRRVRAHGITTIVLALPFFVWSVHLNLTSFDSGVVVFPIAAIAMAVQLVRPLRWVSLIGCLLPAIAYIGGIAVVATRGLTPALLMTYFALAVATWVFLAINGYWLCRLVNEADVDQLMPAAGALIP